MRTFKQPTRVPLALALLAVVLALLGAANATRSPVRTAAQARYSG